MASSTPIPPTASVFASPRPAGRRRQFFRLAVWDGAYAREMLAPMSIGVLALMLALAGNFVYWAIYSIVNQGMSIAPVLKLFLLAMPGFAVQGIPAGTILAVCLVLNRAVRDNEITALRVAGASLPRVLAPFFFMALLASVGDFLIVEKLAPRTNALAEKTLYSLMSRTPGQMIQCDRYFHAGPYYFYVRDVDDKHVLRDVMVYERAGNGPMAAFAVTPFPTVYLAKTAHEDPKSKNSWIFKDVVVHQYDERGALRFEGRWDRHVINIGSELANYWAEEKQPFSMTSSELMTKIDDMSKAAFDANKLQEWRVDLHRRFALPMACFVMALVAAPLALRFARHGSFAGLVLAFALAFFWQGFDGWFRALGIAGRMAPFTAAWLTNGLFFAAGSFLLWREQK